MNRLTVPRVAKAYAQTGLKCDWGLWQEGDSACPLTAVAKAENGIDIGNNDVHTLERQIQNAARGTKLSEPYVAGFLNGYDQDNIFPPYVFNIYYHVGKLDGRKIRKDLGDRAL